MKLSMRYVVIIHVTEATAKIDLFRLYRPLRTVTTMAMQANNAGSKSQPISWP